MIQTGENTMADVKITVLKNGPDVSSLQRSLEPSYA
jgi:hypothetical protein